MSKNTVILNEVYFTRNKGIFLVRLKTQLGTKCQSKDIKWKLLLPRTSMPFWLLQTQVKLWKKHLERIQDWALQTEVCRQGTHFTLHDQCLSDDRHFKIGQGTLLASPYFLNKPFSRPFSLLLTSVFPELVFCCFLPHLVTSSGTENESWHLSC